MSVRHYKGLFTPAFWIVLILPILVQLPVLLGRLNADPILFVGAAGDTAKFVGGAPWIDPNVGFQAQALGKLSADQWLAGHVPWWNSYNGVGLPLAAEAQPGALFLPFVLLYHFRQGFAWVKLLLQIIAGLSTYALLRKIKLTELAAATGAILFEFNGTFAWLGAPIIAPIAFLPLLLLGVEQLLSRVHDRRPGGWLLIPIALAWSLYAGFPETAYINGLLVALWTLVRLPLLEGRQKLLFLSKISLSVGIGLACSLPLIIPFAEYLSQAYVGGHAGFFAHLTLLPPASTALSLAPGLFGPIFQFNDPSNTVSAIWGNIGGYLTALQFAFVLLAVQVVPRRLAIALVSWIVVCLCKTYDIRPISDLVNLIPLLNSVAFFRYAPPSWEFASTVVIALGIDGMQRGAIPVYWRSFFAVTPACAAVLAALWLAKEPLSALNDVPSSARFVHRALAWMAISLGGGLLLILLNKRWRPGLYALAALLIFDALFTFSLPIRSGARHATHNEPGIAFLRTQIGLQRTYSLSPMAPNYGAYFKVAQINHNYLPVSSNWVEYVHQNLDPAANEVTFTGGINRADGYGSASDQLQERIASYEELGVKFVLSSPDVDPFVEAVSIHSDPAIYHSALGMSDGQSAVVHWRVPLRQGVHNIDKISVLIGNYGGQANGVLSARLCLDDSECSAGERSLQGSIDNAPFTINLDHALPTPTGATATTAPMTLTLTHRESTRPVAIWLSGLAKDQAGLVSLEASPSNTAPTISLYFHSGIPGTRQIYAGPDMSIYALANAKPYFEITHGSCTLRALSRTDTQATCSTPAMLLRREAFYPGWTANVDGLPQALQQSQNLFQSVALSPGTHDVVFDYRPTHYWAILLGFMLGVLALAYGAFRELSTTIRSA